MSHDLLDDLLADVPQHVVADPDRAWSAGTGRRRRRYAAEALAVALAMVLVGFTLVRVHEHTPVQPAGQDGTSGHPQSIPRPWQQATLPKRPGPLVGGFEWVDSSDDFGWTVVAPDGRSWTLPDAIDTRDFQPTLSNDGRYLGAVRGLGALVITDLVTGANIRFPDVARAGYPPRHEFEVSTQMPSFWSPDGAHLAVRAYDHATGELGVLVLGLDGSITSLAEPGSPVGWLDDDRLAYLSDSTVRVTNLSGDVIQEVPLQVQLRGLDQWSARVSPDGTQIAVVRDSGPRLEVQAYSLATGELMLDRSVDGMQRSGVQPVWQGTRVLVPGDHGLVDAESGSVVIRIDPRWTVDGFQFWATGALVGPAHSGPGVLEVRYWGLWWHWRWLLGGVLTLLLLGLAAALARWVRADPPT